MAAIGPPHDVHTFLPPALFTLPSWRCELTPRPPSTFWICGPPQGA